jgi:hypothetical protein
MSALNDYDYLIRLDEDASFTSTLPNNLVSLLDSIESGYGYFNEQTSSSQCRQGLNDSVVDFINQVSVFVIVFKR